MNDKLISTAGIRRAMWLAVPMILVSFLVQPECCYRKQEIRDHS